MAFNFNSVSKGGMKILLGNSGCKGTDTAFSHIQSLHLFDKYELQTNFFYCTSFCALSYHQNLGIHEILKNCSVSSLSTCCCKCESQCLHPSAKQSHAFFCAVNLLTSFPPSVQPKSFTFHLPGPSRYQPTVLWHFVAYIEQPALL